MRTLILITLLFWWVYRDLDKRNGMWYQPFLKALYLPSAKICLGVEKIPGWGSLLKGRWKQTELPGLSLVSISTVSWPIYHTAGAGGWLCSHSRPKATPYTSRLRILQSLRQQISTEQLLQVKVCAKCWGIPGEQTYYGSYLLGVDSLMGSRY